MNLGYRARFAWQAALSDCHSDPTTGRSRWPHVGRMLIDGGHPERGVEVQKAIQWYVDDYGFDTQRDLPPRKFL